MLLLKIGGEDHRPLVDQIVVGIRGEIDERRSGPITEPSNTNGSRDTRWPLKPGTRIPSIRSFAERYGVSRFTVVEAYDRPVAMGWDISARDVAQASMPNRRSNSV
jgi:hypothetical protein